LVLKAQQKFKASEGYFFLVQDLEWPPRQNFDQFFKALAHFILRRKHSNIYFFWLLIIVVLNKNMSGLNRSWKTKLLYEDFCWTAETKQLKYPDFEIRFLPKSAYFAWSGNEVQILEFDKLESSLCPTNSSVLPAIYIILFNFNLTH
jgi:hypothetical protein